VKTSQRSDAQILRRVPMGLRVVLSSHPARLSDLPFFSVRSESRFDVSVAATRVQA